MTITQLFTIREFELIEREAGIVASRAIDFLRLTNGDANAVVVFSAVPGRAEDWAAYSGLPHPSAASFIRYPEYDVQNADHVARFGDKLPEETARVMFPQFNHLVYRG